ncbi:hypothetical protein JST97_02290 [bacterium]|nr:hypothetical protein [bacterium]
MLIVGIVLSLVGFVIGLAGSIQLLVAIFRKSGALWGLGSLFIPLVSLFWLFSNWKDGRSPFLRSALGGLIYGTGAAISAFATQSAS